MLSEKEKQELLETARSQSIRRDMRHLAANRQNPLLENGKVDLDRFLEFLNGYNEFINHQPRPFKPMVDRVMKL
ncbi:MAG: hypothetical protein JRJ27_11730 [Deltaproteobacteria bacterium]|nr:hypothetical protein [Deltaproteobacteria bacterium]